MKNPLSKKGALDAFFDEPTGEEASKPTGKQPRKKSDKTGRVSFAVTEETMRKYEFLRDYAYIERLQLADVFDEMLTEYLNNHYNNDKAINGKTWDK